MKKEYNLRNKKLKSTRPPDSESEESDEDSDYTTTSNESTESEIVSSPESDDEEDDSDKDPVNVNITFTLSKDDYEEESDESEDETPPENNIHLQKEVLDKLLELKTIYKDLPIMKELETLHTTESKKYEKRKFKLDHFWSKKKKYF